MLKGLILRSVGKEKERETELVNKRVKEEIWHLPQQRKKKPFY